MLNLADVDFEGLIKAILPKISEDGITQSALFNVICDHLQAIQIGTQSDFDTLSGTDFVLDVINMLKDADVIKVKSREYFGPVYKNTIYCI